MADLDQPSVLERFGYTSRQAQFLTLVARHGGYFLRRQYVTFTGHPHGLATVRFLDQAVTRSHARALPYGRHGHVFHLYARPLYAALGEEDNRNRRTVEWDAVMRKLMTVDFVLAQPEATFWASEREKSELLTKLHIEQKLWPVRHYRSRRSNTSPTARYFVDKMPWYRVPDDPRLWFAYVDAETTLAGFETFLRQYREVLHAVSSGVTYVAPTVWRGAIQPVFERVLAGGQPSVFTLSTLLTYYRLRQKVDTQRFGELTVADLKQFRSLRRSYGEAVDELYARWLKGGDDVVESTDVDRVAPLPCVLQVHALGRRYDLSGTDMKRVATESR
jgi:hypothetical protein